MPDRRQHDRRESNGMQSKNITISLTTFISIIVISITILISIVVCIFISKNSYNRGYDQGMMDSGNYFYPVEEEDALSPADSTEDTNNTNT